MADPQFGLWRQHPISQLVLMNFLPDYRGAVEASLMNRWLGGSLNLTDENEARGRILMVAEIENLSLASLRRFYGVAASAPSSRP